MSAVYSCKDDTKCQQELLLIINLFFLFFNRTTVICGFPLLTFVHCSLLFGPFSSNRTSLWPGRPLVICWRHQCMRNITNLTVHNDHVEWQCICQHDWHLSQGFLISSFITVSSMFNFYIFMSSTHEKNESLKMSLWINKKSVYPYFKPRSPFNVLLPVTCRSSLREADTGGCVLTT